MAKLETIHSGMERNRDDFVELDTRELKTENGIVDVDAGNALRAWFVDPAENTLGIDQHR